MIGSSQRGAGHGSGGGAGRGHVTVLGLGQMGLVCAAMLLDEDRVVVTPAWRAPRVTMWGHSHEECASLMQTRRSDRLPGLRLPDEVRVAMKDADAVGDADLVVCAIPVQYIRGVLDRLRTHIRPGVPIVSVSKGIENGTLMRPTQAIAEALRDDADQPARPLGALSGPTIAPELARCLPATMVAASDDEALRRRVQAAFSTRWLRVYTSADLVGVELAGAMKNVIAIAAGMLDGLQAGYNAKSALLARGLAEIARLGSAMGAHQETFFGVAGVGDLATTCFSPEGRNRTLGEALGRGLTLDQALSRSRHVVEGVATTRAVVDLARRYKVEMPIVSAVNAILFEGLDPIDAIGMLMTRQAREERVG